jgi:copper chaperone CopZ
MLDVKNMTCVACTITITKALEKVTVCSPHL